MFDLTFLNALFLAGIAAGIVPIVIHLLNRRRLKRVEFSDLRFLGAAQPAAHAQSQSAPACCCCCCGSRSSCFTAVAMARPSVRGAFSKLLPTQARSSVLLLVDTSYSMRTEGEDGHRARRRQGGRRCTSSTALERGDQVQRDDLRRRTTSAVRDRRCTIWRWYASRSNDAAAEPRRHRLAGGGAGRARQRLPTPPSRIARCT